MLTGVRAAWCCMSPLVGKSSEEVARRTCAVSGRTAGGRKGLPASAASTGMTRVPKLTTKLTVMVLVTQRRRAAEGLVAGVASQVLPRLESWRAPALVLSADGRGGGRLGETCWLISLEQVKSETRPKVKRAATGHGD